MCLQVSRGQAGRPDVPVAVVTPQAVVATVDGARGSLGRRVGRSPQAARSRCADRRGERRGRRDPRFRRRATPRRRRPRGRPAVPRRRKRRAQSRTRVRSAAPRVVVEFRVGTKNGSGRNGRSQVSPSIRFLLDSKATASCIGPRRRGGSDRIAGGVRGRSRYAVSVSHRIATAWLGLTLAFALGCSEAPRSNLLVVAVDTLRSDHLGVYAIRARSPPRSTPWRRAVCASSAPTRRRPGPSRRWPRC